MTSSDFQGDLSDIERTLLQSYPGESKHLDDSQDHIVSDIFYYTEWDDPIYDQFQDYDYEDKLELVKAEEFKEPEKAAFVPAKEQVSEPSNSDIRIDLNKYPQRLPRKSQGKVPNPGTPAKRCHDDHCKLPDCHCGGSDVPGKVSFKNRELKDYVSVAKISIIRKILASHWSVAEILNCDSSKLLILN